MWFSRWRVTGVGDSYKAFTLDFLSFKTFASLRKELMAIEKLALLLLITLQFHLTMLGTV